MKARRLPFTKSMLDARLERLGAANLTVDDDFQANITHLSLLK